MKKFILLGLVFLVCVSIVDAQNLTPIKKVTAKQIKAIIDSAEGPLIVNFWATWCGPCVRELTYFDSIIAAKKVPVKLLLVSLDFPESFPKKLTAFVKKQGYKGTVVYLYETNADKFIPEIEPKWNGAIPASIFLDHTKHYYQFFNFQLTRERFALEIDHLSK